MTGMSLADSRRCRDFACSWILALFIWAGTCVAWPALSVAADERTACSQDTTPPDKWLACVAAAIAAAERDKPTAQIVLDEPIRGYLESLAKMQGYPGAPGDLDALKSRSIRLKQDPLANREAIAVLDSAIASHIDEVRSAVSTQTLAAQVKPGTDIYRDFVRQKLTYLSSDKVKFYDRGPFEAARRSLLANALEATYFLEKASGAPDQGKLRGEVAVLDELLARYTDPQYDYLTRPKEQQRSRANSNRFWRASILFVLGDKVELRNMLRNLVIENQSFGLDTTEPGHIYIYRAFNLPSQMIAGRDVDGKPTVEIKDPDILNRFYNPAQLALAACTHIEDAGPDRLASFTDAIGGLVYNDYYVVAASAENAGQLQQFSDVVRRAVSSEDLKAQVANLTSIINGQDNGFSRIATQGAQACGIADAVRDEIYSPFGFESRIQNIPGLAKQDQLLLFGGRLNASQARAVADFLGKSIFSARDVQAARDQFHVDATAFTARLHIDK